MADDANQPLQAGGMYKREVKRESPVMAIVQIVLGVAVVGGGLFAYKQYVDERKRVADLITEARQVARGDDAPQLLEAKKKYEEVGADKLRETPRGVAHMAELTAQLWALYGMTELKDEAKEWTQTAVSMDLPKAERYAAEAYIALGEGRPADAERMILDLEKKGIRHAKTLHALSLAKLAAGKPKEARNAADEAMKLDTGLVRLPVAHGDALLAMGNFASAKASFEKAKQLNPAHFKARTGIVLAQAQAREGSTKLQHRELKKLRTEASELNEGKPPPRVASFIEYVDGEVCISSGKEKKALEAAESALQIDPSLTDALALKARALAAMGKNTEALAAIQEALSKVPTSVPYAQAGFEMLHRNNKTKDGVKLLEGVRDANPNNARIYPLLAIAQAKAGMVKECAATAATAIEKLGNAHPDAIFATARALQAEGKFDKAREKYNEAMQEKGVQKWPEVFYEMGHVRLAEKQYADAATLFSTAVTDWERTRADIYTIADGYESWAKAVENQGGKANQKAAAKLRDKAKKLLSGKR